MSGKDPLARDNWNDDDEDDGHSLASSAFADAATIDKVFSFSSSPLFSASFFPKIHIIGPTIGART
eukprot:CAMPEP_0203742264 /NCGR_PEP_ID=MMETSP0092-20131115/57232_1 /ASSEMBLY_ACC=CAM_ASM_001090 /TAXON_ID=426623 /ORGANISM="Chaetoceros affinis, Strain CCMP159" /LENGTH=65 /DNA_ID=CAMNT_0050629361 /DNA_START=136 /DNA_END=329 /DNA_ORIENTATION=+